ncbi:DUF3558 domain-containing protein [Halosaccharopolyspora lacisalsi]|uniref:DUF3558 domain-containing protein n=1 Tax=Halosaccharopolyspora lacisalsi TaxID=1000566 RepID=UPI0015FB294C|nr:DUF3558 domain-containing protein [Halosaccharopolyspora lacisalsi]
MRKFGRGVLTCSGAALLVTLTACSSGGRQAASDPTASKQPSQNQSAIQINNPKDAAAVPLCDLLPAETATALGYETQGRKEQGGLDPDSPSACVWRTPGSSEGGQLALTVLNRKISDYYAHPETWGDFKKLTVAGYPTARANTSDPKKAGICSIYLGTQQSQMISAQVTQSTSKVGKKDPCQVARKALEETVPTLPPAK